MYHYYKLKNNDVKFRSASVLVSLFQFRLHLLRKKIQGSRCAKRTHEEKTPQTYKSNQQRLWQILYPKLFCERQKRQTGW